MGAVLFVQHALDGKIDDLIEIYNTEKITLKNLEDAFVYACHGDHTDVMKQLREWAQKDLGVEHESALKAVCNSGSQNAAKLLFEWRPNLDQAVNDEQPFRCACISGSIELMKFLLEEREIALKRGFMENSEFVGYTRIPKPLNVKKYVEDAFVIVCERNHLGICKKLVNWMPNLDQGINNEKAFRWAMTFSNFKILKFLVWYRPKKLIPLLFRNNCFSEEQILEIVKPVMAGLKISWFIKNQRWNPNYKVGREQFQRFLKKTDAEGIMVEDKID